MHGRWTHGESNEHDHERALGDRARLVVLVLREEEQRRETDLHNIQPYEDVLHGLREEQASSLPVRRLVEPPQELVLVELVEQEERDPREAVDDGGDDAVREGYPGVRERLYRPKIGSTY